MNIQQNENGNENSMENRIEQRLHHAQTQAEWEQLIAQRVMVQTRSELYLALRYLNAALGALALTPAAEGGANGCLATDGARLYYPPAWVLKIYRKNRVYLSRAMLHSLLHCIFRHPWLRDKREPALWGLACDIAVESVLDNLEVDCVRRPVGWLRQQTYAKLKAQCKYIAAGPIYRALCGYDAAELTKLQREFYCDSHRYWPADPSDQKSQMMGRSWEQLGRQTQMEMQQAGRQAGESAAAEALQAQVQAARSRRLYKDFLRRFAVLREEPHLDMDEFDLGYYSYGLRTYGNMPLIEPMESRETCKIRDFVIVIDTSESTAGELVKAFLRETFGLLKTGDSFFTKCSILVMQCDDAVRDVAVLKDLNALERYAAALTLTGGGGTDFRPAFEKIEALCRDGALRDLQGVLYFTDGKGIYPHKRPSFDVAFLFVEGDAVPDESGSTAPEVPPWAMKLVLSPDEFLETTPPKSPLPAIDWEGQEPVDDAVGEMPEL